MARLKDILNDALDLPVEAREAFITRACGADAALLREVRDMLRVHAELGDFLEPPDVSRGQWARVLEAGPTAVAPPLLVGAVLDDRYQLEERLGTGASGAVFHSVDLLTGERVAVKVLTALHHDDVGWFRRELAALRLLELPGVVRLLDDGIHGGLPFLVMPRIDGTRFPGRQAPAPWSEIAGTTISLLETLARIHARGVVHGDLKPANVLVDAAGRPTVLDLGVSSGPSVPGRIEGIAGTPAYLAPEQLQGRGATPRSDLYSVGVMLYEALTGTTPHPADNLEALVNGRLGGPAPGLRERGIDSTSCPCDVIDALLRRDPKDRPESAAHVAARIRGELPPLEALRCHPALRLDATVDAIVEAAGRTSSVTLYGPPRSGRSLCLRLAAAALRRAGKSVLWLDSGARDVTRPALDVVIADSDGGPWERPRGSGCVIRLVDRPEEATVRIQPLTEEALRDLFRGSDRIFHLREDAARELHRRTQGWPVRVADELSAWVRAGLARGAGAAVEIERRALDLLAGGHRICPLPAETQEPDPVSSVLSAVGAGLTEDALAAGTGLPPERLGAALARLLREGKVDRTTDGVYQTAFDSALPLNRAQHAAAARALPAGSERLRHVVAAAGPGEIAREAREAGLALMREGSVGRARAVLLEGIASVRGHGGDPEDEVRLLSALVVVAGAEGTERSFDLTLYEIGRALQRSGELARLEKLARVALLALRRDGERALALADVLGPFDDPLLEMLRQGARAMAARSGPRDHSDEVLRDVEARVRDRDEPLARFKLKEWMGWARYVQGDFDEAVACHEEALELADAPRTRLSAMLNVAESSVEAGRYERARELAGEALAMAARLRHPFYEARAEVALRGAAYRSGTATRVDEELVAAMPALRLSNLEAQLDLNEAAVAWRLGDLDAARRLARAALACWRDIGHLWGCLLSRAFLVALEDEPVDVVAKLEESARDCRMPAIALQALALMAPRVPERAGSWTEVAERLAAQVAPRYRHLRREIASVDECMEWITKKGRD